MSSFAYWQDFLTQSLEGWIETTMGEVFNHRQEKNRSELPLLSVTGSGGVVDRDSLDRRDTSNADKSKYLRVAEGDVVYNTMRMWQGVSGSAPKDGLVSPAYTVLAPTQEIDPSFAKYLVKEERLIQVFHQNSQGLVDDTLNLKYANLSPIKIKIPLLTEQKKIASILTSVDEVIENTQKQIDKLQDLKRATMNELLTKGIGHTEFKDSELGRIPKSWVVRPLDELAKIQTGIAKSSKLIDESVDVPYLRVANVQDGYLDLSEVKTIQVAKSKLERYLLKSGDVLMNEGGDFDKLGRGTVWQGEIFGCVHQNHVFAVRTNRSLLDPQYLKYVAGSENGKKYFIQSSKQSTNLASINSTQLKEMPIPTAPVEEQAAIAKIMKGIEGIIEVRERKLSSFSDLKAALMQDLLTGKVRVSVD